MKIREDFVANSSSCSYIIGRTRELNSKQKEKIIRYVEENFLGEEVLSPESSEEEIREFLEDEEMDPEEQGRIRQLLAQGKSVYKGEVIFDDSVLDVATIHEEIWDLMRESGKGSFIPIETDLSI